jgi:hypothetical protein
LVRQRVEKKAALANKAGEDRRANETQLAELKKAN